MSFAPDRGIWNGASRRAWAIAATATIHAVALVFILFPLRAETASAQPQHLITFDSPVSAPAPSAKPKPRQPRKIAPQPPLPDPVPPPLIEISVVTPQVVALLEQADAQAASGGCDLTAPVQAALQSSTAIQQQLPAIPVERRSVANAIAIWNQEWVQPDAQLKVEVIDTLRSAITTTIEAASQACRMQPQGGPRLIYLHNSAKTGNETTILALGSGAWTWQQVADTAKADAAVPPAQPWPQLFQTAFNP
jgi:hypothetical protein